MKHLLYLFLVTSISMSQTIEGTWNGKLKTPSGEILILFDFVDKENNYESFLSIPQQGLEKLKASNTKFENDSLTLVFSNYNLKYEAKFEGSKMLGKFYQNNFPLTLNLEQGEAKLKRPQQPLPPFNYAIEEISLFNEKEQIELKGSFTYPKNQKKFPIVILISGSGPQDRNGSMFGHEPYHVIADYLSSNGIGVLRYDERGVGESKGNFETSGINEFASDVEAAINFIKSQKKFKKHPVGLIGHSIGGIVAPKVAAKNKQVDFLVLLAAPGMQGDQLMLKQKAAFEKAMGLNSMQIASGQEIINHAYRIIRGSNLEHHTLKDSIANFYVNKYQNMIPQHQLDGLLEQVTGTEVISLIQSNPTEYLSKVHVPVLALNGSKDLQVLPENLELIKTVLEENGNQKVKTIEFENLNHLFQTAEKGTLSEYSLIEETFSLNVLTEIVSWIENTVK